MLEPIVELGRLFLYGAALVVGIGALSHALGWVLTRRGTVRWVWRFWNVVGAMLLLAGLGIVGYGWLVLGLGSPAGGVVIGLGLLLASAGLWMIVPV
jgi:hypothetical protein